MSPRAAWRLETLGFKAVFDYTDGKLDWMATNAQHPRAADVARKELAGDPGQPVEGAMRPGPSTFRPYVTIGEMARFMVEHNLTARRSRPPTAGWWDTSEG